MSKATVCVMSDAAVSPLTTFADHVLVVPAEGASFFPSIVPGLSIAEGICAELVKLDPIRTSNAIAAAETQWQEFDLLQFNSTSSVR